MSKQIAKNGVSGYTFALTAIVLAIAAFATTTAHAADAPATSKGPTLYDTGKDIVTEGVVGTLETAKFVSGEYSNTMVISGGAWAGRTVTFLGKTAAGALRFLVSAGAGAGELTAQAIEIVTDPTAKSVAVIVTKTSKGLVVVTSKLGDLVGAEDIAAPEFKLVEPKMYQGGVK